MLEWIRFSLTAALLVCGLFVLSIGVIGQYRFHFALNRMHAASMGDSLGLLLCLLALCISCNDGFVIIKFLLAIVFLWVASPVGSHLIARLEVTTNERLREHMEVKRL